MSRSDDGKCPDKGNWCGFIRDRCDGDCEIVEHERIVAENARLKKEMDEAAEYINGYLQEIPTYPKAHNWLVRNGYQDESYQSTVYGQEIVTQ
jgi:hypothetical protein